MTVLYVGNHKYKVTRYKSEKYDDIVRKSQFHECMTAENIPY